MWNTIERSDVTMTSDHLYGALLRLNNARLSLRDRGDLTRDVELADLISRISEMANKEDEREHDEFERRQAFEEETAAEHALDVSCIVNAGAN
jgi:hypothetical protein